MTERLPGRANWDREVRGGRPTFGEAIGILVFDGRFPRIPGDMGNATTFPFPVRFEVVPGARGRRIIERDPTLLPVVIEAARSLERAGVKAITTTCGYYIGWQRELADSVSIPLFSSSLMQLPVMLEMLRSDQRVGVITASAEDLAPSFFELAGVDPARVVCVGLDGHPLSRLRDREAFVPADLEAIIMEKAGELKAHADVGAILLECAVHPPYAWRVQEETGLLVFDFTTFASWVYSAAVRRPFIGSL
jgi:hypothetical protein